VPDRTGPAPWPPGGDTAVRFDPFMEAALYDPERGFYGRGGHAGRRGDFITSVEVGPLFAAVLARAIDRWWDELGRPDPYLVVDAGAGTGTFARGLLAARPACAEALRLVLVERSAALAARQPTDPAIEPRTELPADRFRGVIVANELLDNLPFRVVERTAEGWREQWVEAGDATWRPAADVPALDGPIGAVVPYQPQATAWVAGALERLEAGHLLVLDYADTTANLAARGPGSWLRTYRGHERGGPPLAGPGEQDITCEVALDQLPAGAEVTDQATFLRRWGIDELVAEGRRVWEARAHLGDLEALRARSRTREAEALLDVAGLGAFTVAHWTVPPTAG
jgi:SAM-dependent MidA family methyltransferase